MKRKIVSESRQETVGKTIPTEKPRKDSSKQERVKRNKRTIIQKFIAEGKMITEHYLKRVFVLIPVLLEGKELKSFFEDILSTRPEKHRAKVKLIRAFGGCLGAKSRRRTR